ncbi:MAG: hypothetical protein DRO15_00180 [Thermoprotei archaeon]|nr:MAG: hypothetical protein DRO15_00180 [Thermoprotei archaeon]
MELISEFDIAISDADVPSLVSEIIDIFYSEGKFIKYDKACSSSVIIRVGNAELRAFGNVERGLARISIINVHSGELSSYRKIIEIIKTLTSLESLNKARIMHLELVSRGLKDTSFRITSIQKFMKLLKNIISDIGIVINSISTKNIGEVSLVSISGKYPISSMDIVLATVITVIRNSRNISIMVSLSKHYNNFKTDMVKFMNKLLLETELILNYITDNLTR